MQLLELHFNPKKEDKSFDSFIFEPENIYEKRLGSLYLVGEIKNATPNSQKLLAGLAKEIKKNYYKLASKSPDKALAGALKKANDFLSEEVKKDNVSWLGNLNFAVLSLKNFKLNFTETGNIKVILIREGQITDISKELELQEIEPYPLKIFFNTISGKLAEKDLLLILTKEIYGFLNEEGVLNKIAQLESYRPKEIKKQIPAKLFTKGRGSKISGVCLAVFLKEEKTFSGKEVYNPEKKSSFSKIFDPVIRPVKKTKKKLLKIKPSFKKKSQKKKLPKRGEKFLFYSNIASAITAVRNSIKVFKIKRNILLILFLIIILLTGFLLFKGAQLNKNTTDIQNFQEIENKIKKAENFLVFKETKEAESLLKEAWNQLSSLESKKAQELKKRTEKNLKEIYKFQEIENLKIAENPPSFSPPEFSQFIPPPFEFSFDEFEYYLSNIYFLDKKSCEIVKYNKTGENGWGPPLDWLKEKSDCSNPKSLAIDGSIWVLNGDNSILRYYQENFEEKIAIELFPSAENIEKIATKKDFPYLLLLEPDKKRIIVSDKKGKIIKQIYSKELENPQDLKISKDSKSIFILDKDRIYRIEAF